MPKVEAQSPGGPSGERDEGLSVRRLRIPVVDNPLGNIDVGVKIPLLNQNQEKRKHIRESNNNTLWSRTEKIAI